MAAKFLCCLPLRLGVFIISFLQFVFCGACAGFLWWALWTDSKDDVLELTKAMKTTVIIIGVIYTVAAIVGLLGFLGAVFRKNGFIKTFYILLCVVLGLQVGSGVLYLVSFYKNRHQSVDSCINGSKDPQRIQDCEALDVYRRVPQGLVIATVIIPILLAGYACYVVNQYSKRLANQKAERHRQAQAGNVVYQPVKPQDDTYPMLHSTTPPTYPYAEGQHSFGGYGQAKV